MPNTRRRGTQPPSIGTVPPGLPIGATWSAPGGGAVTNTSRGRTRGRGTTRSTAADTSGAQHFSVPRTGTTGLNKQMAAGLMNFVGLLHDLGAWEKVGITPDQAYGLGARCFVGAAGTY